MPVDTGPDNINFQIPEVDLGDTFNTWRDISNLSVYKLNKFKMYEGVCSGSISISVSAGGTALFALQDNVTTGVSFIAPVVFEDGVTFNGPVTFNAPTFTVNANLVTIDDYNLVLGDTAAASDTKISEAGGGGVFINRGSGNTASWIWTPQYIHGLTGIWRPDGHIGFTGGVAGIYPHEGTTLDVHGTAVLLDGGTTSEHGYQISLTTVAGSTTDRVIRFSRYSPAGATVFMEVVNGATYATAGLSAGQRPFVSIPNGVNKKTVKQTGHAFSAVGIPLSLNSSGVYFAAKADSATNAEVVGIISSIIDGDTFEITFIGEVFGIGAGVNADGTSLITGSVYYLSPYTAGKITATQPTQAGVVHKGVMIATSPSSAIVYPWTGGIMSEPLVLSSSAQTSVRIVQLNQFKLGDIVRFKPGNTTLTYGAYTATYPDGIYVRAQANTTTESEVAGIVILREEIGSSGVYRAFNLLMDGFYEFPAGISATNGGSKANIQSGKVYFLNSGCAGTTGSLEKAAEPCYNDAPPTIPGYVRKPMLFSTSTTTGYLYSYRGDVTGLPGLSANTPLDYLLIQDLGSCGAAADLNFGVRNASGSAGGTRVMTFDGTTRGNVRIGPATFTSTSVGAGATLSVEGPILAGDRVATMGSVIIASRYGVYPETANVFGTQYSSGNTVLATGLRGKTGAAGYELTTNQNWHRSLFELGGIDNRPGFYFGGYSLGATNGSIGSNAPITEYFKVIGGNASVGTCASIGGSPQPAFVIQGSSPGLGGQILFREVSANAWRLSAPRGANERFVVTDAWNGATAMVIAPHVSSGASGCFVGIGTDAPATKLHVLGEYQTPGLENKGTITISGASLGGRQLQLGVSGGAAGAWIEGWNPGLGTATLTLQPTGGELIVGGGLTVGTRIDCQSLRINGAGSTEFRITQASMNVIHDFSSGAGGWARGIKWYRAQADIAGNSASAGLGTLGSADSNPSTLYFAYGPNPWASGKGLYISPDGSVGVGFTAPGVSLDVNGVIRGRIPAFSVSRVQGTAAQTTSGTISWNTKITDTLGNFNTTTGLFTAPISGTYEFSFAVFTTLTYSTASTYAYYQFTKNGTAIGPIFHSPNNSSSTVNNIQYLTVPGNIILTLVAGDTIGVYATFSGAGAVYANNYHSFVGKLIGR